MWTYPATITGSKPKPLTLEAPNGNEVTFTIKSVLTQCATTERGSADKWAVTITASRITEGEPRLLGSISTEYSTDVEHRKQVAGAGISARYMRDYPRAKWTLCRSFAVRPAILDVLICLASDSYTWEELRDEREPLEYMAEMFGYEKPSECARVHDALRLGYADFAELAIRSGWTAESFAQEIFDLKNEQA